MQIKITWSNNFSKKSEMKYIPKNKTTFKKVFMDFVYDINISESTLIILIVKGKGVIRVMFYLI